LSEPYLIGSVLYNDTERVAKFVADRVPLMAGRTFQFGPDGKPRFVALGVVRRGKFAAGVVFHNYHGHDIEMSAAADDPLWCLPETLRQLFAYPFAQLNCVRMTTITGRKNKRARKIDERLGFRLEGVVRKGIDGKEDAVIYGLLKSECKWIKDNAVG
jgi:hypothetical protein